MKIQIFSDLHGEAYFNPKNDRSFLWRYVEPSAPVAIVAGDIDSRQFVETLNEIATKFEKVIAVMGNHEWYHKDISWRPDITKLASNVSLLTPGVCEYEDVVFIGGTLWTDFNNNDFFVIHSANKGINDFYIISDGEHKYTAQECSLVHQKERKFFDMMIEKYRGKKIVIVSHFLPSYELVHPKWKNPSTDTLNRYFSSNCDDLIEKSEASLWVFGHTHDQRDMEIHGVRCVCNPIGYPGEKKNIQKDFVVEI